MTVPNSISDQISIGAKELVNRSQDLGISWGLRQATVTTAGAGTAVKVVVDGDNIAIPVNSTLPQVDVGDRVYIMTTPPGGNILIGHVNSPGNVFVPSTGYIDIDGTSGIRGVRGFAASTGVGNVTTVKANFLSTAVSWVQNHVYEITFSGSVILSTSTNVCGFTLSNNGSDFYGAGAFGPSGATPAVSFHHSQIFVRSGATASQTLALTAQIFSAGTGTLQHSGTQRYTMRVVDIGLLTDFPNYANAIAF